MKRQVTYPSIRHLFIGIIIVQLFWLQLSGLDPNKTVDQYMVDHWGVSEGLPTDMILSIAQTSDGYLWLSTEKGLVRFDGVKFSIIPFIEKEHNPRQEPPIPYAALCVDREGTLWIGSAVGLTSYRYQTGRFKTFTPTDGSTWDRIRRIKNDVHGNLWISFESNYVSRFFNGTFTAYNASHGLKGKKVNTIVEDQKGNLLFGTIEDGLFTFKDDKFSKYPVPGLENFQVRIMYEDRNGDLWIGTTEGLFKLSRNRIERYTVKNGLSDNFVSYIMEDSEDNLWIGTVKGLNRAKKNKNGAIVFENLLKPSTIFYLFEDNEKNLWVSTYASGLNRLKDSTFTSYAPLDAYPEEIISSMYLDRRGDNWVGTMSGTLFQCRGDDLIDTLQPPELSGTGIAAIAEDADGDLWLGTIGKGVFQVKGGKFIQYTTRDNLADNQVTSVFKDSRGNLWFGTSDGLSVRTFPDRKFKTFTAADGLSSKVIHNVYEDSRRDIRITTQKGIALLLNKSFSGVQGGKFRVFQKSPLAAGGKNIPVSCIHEDASGAIHWIATDGHGLIRLRFEDGEITTYTTDEGLASNYLYQFFEDRGGNFWLMSDRGVLRVSKSDLNRFAGGNPEKIHCISYGVSDGLKSPEFSSHLYRSSALETPDGRLWFLTRKGISIVDPEKITLNKVPPPVRIEAVFFDRKLFPNHREATALTVEGKKSFTAYFTAPTFLSPEKVRFKYRLEGYDREWVYLPDGSQRVTEYKGVGPGTYTFTVIACSAEGVWNRAGDAITFTVKPYFHQTLLFKIFILFLIVVSVFGAFYIHKTYKKRSAEKRERDKYKNSRLNPRFAEECIKKLNTLMETEKVFLDEKISLDVLAGKLSIQPYQLSQVLNEKLKQTFFDFINYHRIEEAKRMLTNPKEKDKKISTLAGDVGFNSITAFYKAFKKYTGMTPKEYKEVAPP